MNDGQMSEALRNMAAHRAASHAVERRGWTSQQWADDAKRLMGDLDGSVSSLLNGHVMGLIDQRDAAVARAEAAEQALQRVRTMADTGFCPIPDSEERGVAGWRFAMEHVTVALDDAP